MINKNKSIVVNTSPWIALSMCGQISLLKKLYHKVYIPQHVKGEIMAGGEQDIGVHELKTCSWIKVGKVVDVEKVKLLYELDKGEAEVIIIAREKGIKNVMIDEKVARLQAKILGLEVIGTLGLLLKAKRKGIIHSIKPHMMKMLDNNIWIRKEIVKGILKEAGEEF